MHAVRTTSLLIAGLVCFAAPPAHAADKAVHVYLPGHSDALWAGRGTWHDADNRLCALLGQNDLHDKLVVRIRPTDGEGSTFKVVDPEPFPAAEGTCSESLSLPENRRYRMRVTVHQTNGDRYSVSSPFRT